MKQHIWVTVYALYCAIVLVSAQVIAEQFIGAWAWLIPIAGVLAAGWYAERAVRLVRADLAWLRRLIRTTANRQRG